MDAAFGRTRRNMIAISVALVFLYGLDWSFPTNLRLANYEFKISDNTLELVAWVFLIYLAREYFVHIKSKIELVDIYWHYLAKRLESRFETFYRQFDELEGIMGRGFDSTTDILVGRFCVIFDGDKEGAFNYMVYEKLDVEFQKGHINRIKTPSSGRQFSVLKKDVRFDRIVAWFGVGWNERVGYEYLWPIVFPCSAAVLMVFRKIHSSFWWSVVENWMTRVS